MPQTPSGSDTSVLFAPNQYVAGVNTNPTPNAAVLCDINGTPQWCHDGTEVPPRIGTCSEGQVVYIGTQGEYLCAAFGPFRMKEAPSSSFSMEFQSAWSGATGVLGGLAGVTAGLFLPLALIAALIYTTYRAYFTKPTRRK